MLISPTCYIILLKNFFDILLVVAAAYAAAKDNSNAINIPITSDYQQQPECELILLADLLFLPKLHSLN